MAIGIVVALLLAATAAWLAGALSLSTRPPDLVGVAARPLRPPVSAAPRPPATPFRPSPEGVGLPPLIGTRPLPPLRDPPIGRFLGSARRGGTAAIRAGWWTLGLIGEAREAFARGFIRRIHERAVQLAADPRQLLAWIGREGLDPVAAFRRMTDLRAIVRYLGGLRGMPAREAVLRAAEDAGEQAADQAIALLLRRGIRAGGRHGKPLDDGPRASGPVVRRGSLR